MASNIEQIIEVIKPIVDVPIFCLNEDQKADFDETFSTMFSELKESFPPELTKTEPYKIISKLDSLVKKDDIDELEFFNNLREMIVGSATKEEAKPALIIIDKILVRAQPMVSTERLATEKAQGMPEEEIYLHDQKIIVTMQFYAFDYFLYVYKLIKEGALEQKIQAINKGQKDMPALFDDAIAEDMLTKIVYSLLDLKVRKQMIIDYYRYKMSFINVADRNNLTVDEVNTIETVLKTYCLSLIPICQTFGIQKMDNGFHFPYGQGYLLEELKDKL